MKKYLALLLALVMVLSLCACGNSAPAATEAPAAEPAAEPAADDLVSLAQAEGELVVYGSCEEEYLAAACENFEKLYNIKTTYQRLSTGEVQAKIEEENGNPSADVWFGGTTDPYNVVAGEGLLEAYEAENASHLLSDMYRDKDGYWYGIYKGILGFMVNTDELAVLQVSCPAPLAKKKLAAQESPLHTPPSAIEVRRFSNTRFQVITKTSTNKTGGKKVAMQEAMVQDYERLDDCPWRELGAH